MQVLGDGEGILAMPLHPEGQGFDALERLPGVVGREAGAEVAQRAGAHSQNIGERRKWRGQVVAPPETVIGAVGFVEKRMFAAGPVEFPGVDDDAADAGAVAAEPLGKRVDDNVRTVLDRFGEVRRGEGGIDDERQAVDVGDF